jgi:hypothetical protein
VNTTQLKKSQEEVQRLSELLQKEREAPPSPGDSQESSGGLDISRAVAATEPHVSQLMEDLETISREKEKLGAEKEIAERKCSVAISLAEKQKVPLPLTSLCPFADCSSGGV